MAMMVNVIDKEAGIEKTYQRIDREVGWGFLLKETVPSGTIAKSLHDYRRMARIVLTESMMIDFYELDLDVRTKELLQQVDEIYKQAQSLVSPLRGPSEALDLALLRLREARTWIEKVREGE